jgi:hypothetical protein
MSDTTPSPATGPGSPARSVQVTIQRVQYIDVDVPPGFDLYAPGEAGARARVDLLQRALQAAADEVAADPSACSWLVDAADGLDERTLLD